MTLSKILRRSIFWWSPITKVLESEDILFYFFCSFSQVLSKQPCIPCAEFTRCSHAKWAWWLYSILSRSNFPLIKNMFPSATWSQLCSVDCLTQPCLSKVHRCPDVNEVKPLKCLMFSTHPLQKYWVHFQRLTYASNSRWTCWDSRIIPLPVVCECIRIQLNIDNEANSDRTSCSVRCYWKLARLKLRTKALQCFRNIINQITDSVYGVDLHTSMYACQMFYCTICQDP